MPSTELLVDSEFDSSNDDLYFITPENLNQLRFVRPSSFSKATIRNCHVSHLTSYNLQSLFNSLKKGCSATITLDEPVLVLHEYDTKAIIANAELAGFKGIKTGNTHAFCKGLGTKINTVTITFTK